MGKWDYKYIKDWENQWNQLKYSINYIRDCKDDGIKEKTDVSTYLLLRDKWLYMKPFSRSIEDLLTKEKSRYHLIRGYKHGYVIDCYQTNLGSNCELKFDDGNMGYTLLQSEDYNIITFSQFLETYHQILEEVQ